MIIKIPKNNIAERKYIIDIIIGEFLNISYSIEISDTHNYHLIFNEKELVIEDHFFNLYKEDFSYLERKNIPSKVVFGRNQFISEKDVVILYGTDKVCVEKERIICGNDIFATSFFMLTRWEEYVNPIRDQHNRFSALNSTAYKLKFLDRPIVNEYVEMLWEMLLYLGFDEQRKEWKYNMVLTHDVDILQFYKGPKTLIRKIGAEIVRKKSLHSAFQYLKEYIKVKMKIIPDPFDTFSWIMDLSEEVNVKSRFYFMSGGTSFFDNHYQISSPRALKIIEDIKKRGHIIGFHPSYNAYEDSAQWRKEKEQLERIVKQKITEGRQHYLRFELPTTWRLWNENKMERDLTLSYADKEGFRCGVCYEFSVFDILNRNKLELKEMPLIVMEGSFISYQNVSAEIMYLEIMKLLKKVYKYNGSFVFLWHNSSFNTVDLKKYQQVYESVLKGHNTMVSRG